MLKCPFCNAEYEQSAFRTTFLGIHSYSCPKCMEALEPNYSSFHNISMVFIPLPFFLSIHAIERSFFFLAGVGILVFIGLCITALVEEKQ